MDALRAATPFVVVVAVPSKTSLDRRRGVVVDEDAVETSDDAARRRNMDGREKHGRVELGTPGSPSSFDRASSFRASVVSSVASWRIPTPRSKP